MEDTIDPNISVALYRYLCHNIVGSKDYVKRIRYMNAVKDNINSIEPTNDTLITSGSVGEGLEMRGSDVDTMFVLNKSVEVCEDKISRFNPKITYLFMESDDVKPCYTLLNLEYRRYQDIINYCHEHNGKQYFSSALHKQRYLNNTLTIHGPCLSDQYGFFDNAISLHCKTWISPALQWLTRSNNSWPSHNVKQSIIKHGVLFVPIGVKESPKQDIEWRVSFSVGEKFLINTFTHTQLLCYALFKIVLKVVIATYSECKDLLCSYFLKTIIFWLSEELPQSVWKPNNMIPCFMRCFSRLIYCVEHSVCLHYFIPENNLFENKIEGRSREILLEKLYTLYSYGWRCILFSDQISNFNVLMLNPYIEPHTLCFGDTEKILKSRIGHMTTSKELTVKNGILQIALREQSHIKDVYKYYMSIYSSGHAQHLSLDSTNRNNRYQYKQYKSCLSTLLQSVNHDAVSGWLMLASIFYKTKQYSKTLCIIKYSISKCTPEKLCYYSTVSDYQWSTLNSFQKMSFLHLEKIMFVDDISFTSISWLIPDEIQMIDSIPDGMRLFPSTAYAYFLDFLCHFHLNNVRQCQDSLQGLQLVIEEDYFISHSLLKANSYTLLENALQLFGRKESARRAFVQSVELFPYEEYKAAVCE